MKRIISLLLALILILGVLCGCASKSADDDSLHITFRVTHDDGEMNEFKIATTKTTLGDALFDEKLVPESEYSTGFYSTIDGEYADWEADEGWWCLYCNGEMLMVGANETELVDGAVYEAIFTHGFD